MLSSIILSCVTRRPHIATLLLSNDNIALEQYVSNEPPTVPYKAHLTEYQTFITSLLTSTYDLSTCGMVRATVYLARNVQWRLTTMGTYSEGYEAFHRGINRSSNPWAEGGREWKQWFEGWDTAERSSND